jgi:dienelactone hydrolase
MSELVGRVSEEIRIGGEKESLMRKFEGTFTSPRNDPSFKDGQFLGQESSVAVSFAIHPNASKRIIIMIPGFNGNMDGIDGDARYKRLADQMQSEGLGAVIRTNNLSREGYLPDINLRAALQCARDHALETCQEANPEILLMGYSAGAGAIAAVASEYPEVTKILLLAPSEDMPGEMIQEGLGRFGGEIYVVIGEEDEVVGVDTGQRFLVMATQTDESRRHLTTILGSDHRFSGETDKITSEAFRAFAKG